MHCGHKRVWETECLEMYLHKGEGDAPRNILLKEGWEPYEVIMQPNGYYTYFFKRLTSCQICAKEKEDILEDILKEQKMHGGVLYTQNPGLISPNYSSI